MANARQQNQPKALIRRTLESARRDIEQIERKFHHAIRAVQNGGFTSGRRSTESSDVSDQDRRWSANGPSRTGSDGDLECAEEAPNGSHDGSSPSGSAEVR